MPIGYSASLAFCSATACIATAPMKFTGWQKLGWKNRSTLASWSMVKRALDGDGDRVGGLGYVVAAQELRAEYATGLGVQVRVAVTGVVVSMKSGR